MQEEAQSCAEAAWHDDKYKARLVAHGFSQVRGIDCDTFAPTVRP